MTPPLNALIDEVHRVGAELVVMNGALKLVGDRSRITADLRARLRAKRDELIAYLRPHPCVDCGHHLFADPGTVCYWCQRRPADR
jgi:hypothetical protein